MGKKILKQKKYQKSVSLRELKRRKIYKTWRKKRNLLLILTRNRKKQRQKQQKNETIYLAPEIFLLRDNTNEVIRFMALLREHQPHQGSVYIDMSKVKKIANGSIGMLLSVANILSRKNIIVSGSKPENRDANRTLERSGFFNFVQGHVEEENRFSTDTMIARGKEVVNQVASSRIVMDCMKTITSESRRNQPIQRMLIEMMANSVNHAFPYHRAKNINKWVLAVSHDSTNKKVTFSFIDNGVGIIETLKLNIRQKLKFTIIWSNKELLETAFQGNIGSRTGLAYRGRGLPSILKNFKSNNISELVVISNNVFLDFQNDIVNELDTSFQGTFYYWEISQSCNYNGKYT